MTPARFRSDKGLSGVYTRGPAAPHKTRARPKALRPASLLASRKTLGIPSVLHAASCAEEHKFTRQP